MLSTLLLCSWGSLIAQESLDEVITSLNSAINSFTTVNYKAEFEIKYFSDIDTSKKNGVVAFERDNVDTLFHGKINIIENEIYQTVYDLKKLISLQHKNKTAVLFDIEKDQSIILNNNSIKDFIPNELLRGINLVDLKLERAKLSLLKTDLDSLFWIIQINWDDALDFSNRKRKIWINKNTHLPEKIESQVSYKNEHQYKSWKISSLSLNEKIIPYTPPSDYEISNYKEFTFEDILNNLLQVGAESPDFSGITLNNKFLEKQSFKGSLILLDFWFIGCLPCIESIPFLNELQAKYSQKNLNVLGLNAMDKNKELLMNFSQEKNIDYTILSIEKGVLESFHILAFPTYYLINTDAKILWRSIGLSNDEKQKLIDILNNQ